MSRILMHFTFRADTAANWTSNDPTLLTGEIGYETDTGLFKVGDGSTAWTSHTYANITESTLTTTSGDLVTAYTAADAVVSAAYAAADTTISGDIVAQLHTRGHTISSTADHTGSGNWKVIYTNGSGNITELSLGASGTVLTSQGAGVAPVFV